MPNVIVPLKVLVLPRRKQSLHKAKLNGIAPSGTNMKSTYKKHYWSPGVLRDRIQENGMEIDIISLYILVSRLTLL